MLAVSAWYLRKRQHVESFHRTAKVALIVLIPTIVIQLSVGNQLGVIETSYQPMKIAAAEAQWNSCKPCSFSAAPDRRLQPAATRRRREIIPIPHLLSVLATGTWSGQVTGLNQLQAQYQQKYGPGNYIPNVAIQYWSMRIMAGPRDAGPAAGAVGRLAAAAGTSCARSRLFLTLSVWAVVTPFLMNTAGLAADRERAPAVDRAGPAEDGQRELAVGQRHRDLDQPDRVRPVLHRARRRRPGADAPLLAPRPGARRRRGRRAERRGRAPPPPR